MQIYKRILLLAFIVSAFAVGAMAQVSVTATAGTPGPTAYTTLTDAFTAINAGTHQGAITVSITGNTTEPANTSAVLNSSGAGAASYTSVLVRPTVDGVTITGAGGTGTACGGRGLIELNGADNVTIDGDNPNSAGTNRNLTLTDTCIGTYASVIRIALATTIVTSADNNIFRNLIINGSAPGRNITTATSTTGTENTTYGILATGGASTVAATTAPATITSTSTLIGAGATAANLTIDNNTVTTAARGIAVQGSATTVFPGLAITNNIIGNPTAGAADQVYSFGITAQGSTDAVIRSNVVNVESFLGTSIRGIDTGSISATGTGFLFERNMVNRVANKSTGGQGAYGINISSGGGHTIRNNFVSGVINVANATFSTTFGAHGIRIASGTGHFIYHNSVNMYGDLTGTGAALTAALTFTSSATTGIDARNNILVNTQTETAATTPASSAFVAIYLPSGLTSAYGLTLNNNDYFIGATPAVNNGYGQRGTPAGAANFFTTFNAADTADPTNLRSYTSTLNAAGTNDNASKAVDPQFVSATDLHIAAASPVVNMGVDVGVLQDIDGQNRVGIPDIGADEPGGVTPPANDIAATAIVAPANGSTFGIGATVTPQATFTNVGTATQTNVMVQFTITGPGGYSYSNTQTIATINPNQTVTVTFAATPAFTTAGSYTTTATVLTADQNTANNTVSGSFTVVPPVAGGNVNVGTGGDFTSLTNPGGLFSALNAGGATGNIVVNITSDLAGETGAVALNQLAGGFTVTIKPSGAARTITGTTANLIKLNGADNVTIDGSLNGGTDRSLTIINPTASTAAYVVWIASVDATNGATNDTVKNTNIVGNAPTTTFVGLVSSGSVLGGVAEAANTNTTFRNNAITASQFGIAMVGPTGNETGNSVTLNSIGSTVAASKVGTNGIAVFQQASATVANNTVQGVNTATTTTATGIRVAGTANGISINANSISDVKNTNTGGFGANGIQLNSSVTTANVTVSNNFISDVTGFGFNGVGVADNGYGIIAVTGGGYNIYFNSISLTTDQTAAGGITAALNITSGVTTAGSIDLRNNILSDQETVGNRYGVINNSTALAAVFSTINYNDYFAQNVGRSGATIYTTLADWQTYTGQDANSKAVDPLFTSATDLHILTGSPVINMGITVAGITTDIDGQARDAMPDIGADEFGVAQPGVLALSSSTYSVAENVAGGLATITVNRTGGTDNAVSVTYTLTNGSATGGATCAAGVDFINTGGTVNFAAGQASQTFTVQICDDAVFEGNETFNVILGTATGGATVGTPASAVVTIIDNEVAQPGTIALSSATYMVGESAGTVTITVNRTGGTDGAVSVPYTLGGGTATGGATCAAGVDYVNTGGTVDFANGIASQTFTVTICNDTVNEPTETFIVTLGTPTGGATLGTPSSATVTIIDDDVAGGLGGIVNVGTGQTYTSLTNPGGAFEALNNQGATANVTFAITSDLTGETGAVALNEVAGGFTVTIKPSGAARTISGTSAASSGLIILNGADNVTIDGSLTGSNDRSLTITNAQATTSVVIWIRSASATNGATADTVKNTNLAGAAATNIIAGVLSGGSTFGSAAAAPNSNNTIQNNTVIKVQNALFLSGNATTFDQNWLITDNIFGSTTADEKLSFRGMLLGGANNFTITKNTIMGVVTTSSSTTTGIQLSANATNGVITRNNISDVKNNNAGGFGANGIFLAQASTTANDLVANNFIRDIAGVGFAGVGVADNGYGIVVASGGGYNIYFNSVNLATDQTAAGSITGAINILAAVTTAGAVNLRDNILVNTETIGTRFAVIDSSSQGAAVFSAIDYNDYFAQNVGRSGTTAVTYPTLAAWQGFTGMDANSKAVDPLFVSPVNLHILDTSPLVDMGIPIPSVINDFDGQVRSTTTPDIGADETFGIIVQPGTLALSSNAYSVGEAAGTVTITVNRTGGTDGAVSAAYTLANGTATGGATCVAGVDFINTGGMVNFAAAQDTATFTVTICNDTLVEANETFTVTLANPTGGATIGTPATATVTIVDDDVAQPGVLALSASTYSVGEAAGTVTITVNRTGGSDGAVSVPYTLTNGTATGGATCAAGVDFINTGGTVNFAAGTTTQTFTVMICNDTLVEPNETFNVVLGAATGGATVGTPSSAVVTIIDDDVVVPSLSINTVRVREGNSGTVNAVFTVTASQSSTTAFTVNYATANGTATAGVDYVATSGTLTFAPGQTTQTITVQVIGDTLKEANETFFVNLSAPNGATIANAQGVGIIIDDDRAYRADYDNDKKTDLSVFRGSNGFHYLLLSNNDNFVFRQFGLDGDIPVPGDYDGDAITDLAVFRPSQGSWYIMRSSDSTLRFQMFGFGTDKPVQGDYDGDAKTDIAVFRNGTWFVLNSSTNSASGVVFGTTGDIPVQSDYNGDARTDYAVYRNGSWFVLNSNDNSTVGILFGAADDKPLTGDFDGDGKSDFAVYRSGVWYILQTLTFTTRAVVFGAPDDIPVVGDYDGDGTSDIAVFRPSNGVWYRINSSTNAFFARAFGQMGDIPIPARYQAPQP